MVLGEEGLFGEPRPQREHFRSVQYDRYLYTYNNPGTLGHRTGDPQDPSVSLSPDTSNNFSRLRGVHIGRQRMVPEEPGRQDVQERDGKDLEGDRSRLGFPRFYLRVSILNLGPHKRSGTGTLGHKVGGQPRPLNR